MLPFIQKYKTFSFYGSVVLCIFSWLSISYVLPPLPLIVYAGSFMPWIYFFVLGVFLTDMKNNYSIWGPIILIIIGVSLQYLEALYSLNEGRMLFGQKVTSVISNTGIILLLFSTRLKSYYSSTYINRIFEYWGFYSFGIYLVHCYFLYVLSFFRVRIVYWSLKCFAVILLTSLFIIFVRAIIPKNVCVKYWGFK